MTHLLFLAILADVASLTLSLHHLSTSPPHLTRRDILLLTTSPLLLPSTASAKIPPPSQASIDEYLFTLKNSPSFRESLKRETFPRDADFTDPSNFARLDSSPDTAFYTDPKLVEHIDDNAVQLLTKFNSDLVTAYSATALLDVCASHVSHVNPPQKLASAVGVGMNEKELSLNPLLTEFFVRDLNVDGKLPAVPESSFDVALLQLSIDYLTKPTLTLNDIAHKLKPRSPLAITFSDRLFLSKAVSAWSGKDDFDHIFTVMSYFAAGGELWNLDTLKASVLCDGKNGKADPLFAVVCERV